jgi:hypothetical protein
MTRRLIAGLTGMVCALSIGAQPVAAAQSTGDLIPDASYPWQADTTRGGALTAQDIYGSKASQIKGFVDAYEKVWKQTDQGLANRLERFSSVFWAGYRFGQSEGADKKDTKHNSFVTVPAFGSGAYEVTDPADAQGVATEAIVFVQGDYVAVVAIARRNGAPDEAAMMAQARAQLAAIPEPTGEVQSIGNGVITFVLIAGAVALVAAIVIGAVLFIVFRRGRRQPPVVGGGVTYSPDGRWWWDGSAWRPVDAAPPPTPG